MTDDDDIVGRLRARYSDEERKVGLQEPLLDEAADEIDKLRKGWLDQAARDATEIVRLEVEIERLRAACQLMIDGKWDRACKAARAALAEAKP